jgi:DNA end-binding protein Ku
MWKGAVSFGLVTVPVRMYSATESHDLQFRQVRASDGSRIRYRRVAEADGEEVPYDQIAKGYETPDGRMVVLSEEDLESLPNKSSKEIEVDKFVPAEQIDPILFDKAYYLEPDKASAKSYSLLRETLRDSDRMAVVTISVRSRMTMAILRVRDDVIVLQTLLWPDEIRKPEFDTLSDVPEPSEREVKMAHLLVESLSEDFDPRRVRGRLRRGRRGHGAGQDRGRCGRDAVGAGGVSRPGRRPAGGAAAVRRPGQGRAGGGGRRQGVVFGRGVRRDGVWRGGVWRGRGGRGEDRGGAEHEGRREEVGRQEGHGREGGGQEDAGQEGRLRCRRATRSTRWPGASSGGSGACR